MFKDIIMATSFGVTLLLSGLSYAGPVSGSHGSGPIGGGTGSGGAGGSGTVSAGNAGYITYYPTTGTTVDDQTVIYTNGSNVGIGTTKPSTLFALGVSSSGGSLTKNAFNIDSNGNITNLGGIQCNINAATVDLAGAGYAIKFGNNSGTAGSAVDIHTENSTGYITLSPGSASEKFRIDANGNVGLGTTLPAVTLDVLGNINGYGLHTPNDVGGITSAAGIVFDPTGEGTLVTISSGRNVGIGSANPGTALDVVGTIRATAYSFPAQFIQSTNINWANVNGIGSINSGSVNWSNLNGTATINTGGVNWSSINGIAKINSGGVNWTSIVNNEIQNAGINWANVNALGPINNGAINWANVNAAAKLNTGGVNWTSVINSEIRNAGINWTNVNGSGSIKEGAFTFADVTTANVSTSAHGLVPKLDNSLTHFLNGQGGYTTPTVGAASPQGGFNAVQYNHIGSTDGDETKLSFNATNIGIGTTNGKALLDVEGQVYVNGGNVGVGTLNPGTAIDVSGVVRATSFNGSSSGLTGLVTLDNPSASVGLAAVNGSASTAIRSDGAPALSVSITPTWTGKHIFSNATNSAIFSGGPVGIGTAVPTALLEIEGGNVGIGTATTANILDVFGSIVGGTYAGQKNGSSNSIVTSGNIGSGTYQPNANLTVVAATPTLLIRAANFGGGSSVNISNDESQAPNAGNAQGSINFQTSKDGNHGLTTVTSIVSVAEANGSGSSLPTYLQFKTTPSGSITVTERMRIDASGNVGIGSTAPQAKLDLGTSGVIVSHSTTGVGISIKTGANTACNTTCGTSACWVGFDNGTVGVANSQPVDCTDATADRCECLGP